MILREITVTSATRLARRPRYRRCAEISSSNRDIKPLQVPFEVSVEQVAEQLRNVAKGEYTSPSTEKRKFGNIVFAAVDLPDTKIQDLLNNMAKNDPRVEALLTENIKEDKLKKAHVTLAHKRSHGVTAVANYGMFLHRNVPVDMTALLFTDKMAAIEVSLGSVDGEKIISKNEWPHITLWTAQGVAAKEANTLPQLFSEGKATCIEINPPVTISGVLEFY